MTQNLDKKRKRRAAFLSPVQTSVVVAKKRSDVRKPDVSSLRRDLCAETAVCAFRTGTENIVSFHLT